MKTKHFSKDYECTLALGLLIGFFLLPELGSFSGFEKLFISFAVLCGAPLIALAGLFFIDLFIGRRQSLRQAAKYLLVSLASLVINIGVFDFFVNASGVSRGLPVAVIAAVAFFAALLNSYIWSSHWVFPEGFTGTVHQFESFFLVTFIGLLVNITAVIMLNIQTALVLFVLWNYFAYKYLVFKVKKK